MAEDSAKVIICGAGIAGISAAYYLVSQHQMTDILLVDERPPLTLTSDKSTEAYRNWWPGPDSAMIALMNRSIDLLEELASESSNLFHLNRRGYLYATANPGRISEFIALAERAEEQGAGPIRTYRGLSHEPDYIPVTPESYLNQPAGCDLILDPTLIYAHYPYLSQDTVALLHARRCGWFSGQQLGMYLLERAIEGGARLLRARVEDILIKDNQVEAVRVHQNGRQWNIFTPVFINAAGPMIRDVGRMVGVELPVYHERHLKVSIRDTQGVLPRDAPLLIWEDPQFLHWDEQDRELFAESDGTQWMVDQLPAGVHIRPEGGKDNQNILFLWPYDLEPVQPTFPIQIPEAYPEVALRGLIAILPGMDYYTSRFPKPTVDGGYYTKTSENRLLCGPLPVAGAYVLGALSGFGLMAACGAGELLASHITGGTLPDYAPAFMLSRYENNDYQEKLRKWSFTGQL
jgi:glycine/D-amino acid oxidase-like deaminating enzyme